jgi:plasmid stabilization system protein ParE
LKPEVRTTPEADRQILGASTWWRVNRPASPDLFDAELDRAFTLLAEAPDIGRRYRMREIPGVRRILLSQSRYHVYYVHDEKRGEVLVLAIWSAVRGRGPRVRRP